MVKISFTLNGKEVDADVPANTTPLHVLGDEFGILRVNKGCKAEEHGA